MLSVVDLLEAGTLSMPQAAHLVARIEAGASWLVGARPGGAGKTTIMSALLAMLPPNEPVWIAGADPRWESARPGECIVAYEISPGPFHGYIWGGKVRQMTQRGMAGCRLVANLHADTVAEARQQIVEDCGAAEEGFRAFDLFLPITLQSTDADRTAGTGWERRVEQIWESRDGAWGEWAPPGTPPVREREIAHLLADCAAKGLRTVEQVRQAWLARGAGR